MSLRPGSLVALLLLLLSAPAPSIGSPAAAGENIESAVIAVSPSRIHLGRLLQWCDDVWLATDDPIAKARAVPLLSSANQNWMRGERFGTARDLARAVGALRREEGATTIERWAGALSILPELRTIDGAAFDGSVPFSITVHDPTVRHPATGGAIEIVADGHPAARVEIDPADPPEGIVLALPAEFRGDVPCSVRILHDGEVVREYAEAFGIVDGAHERTRAILRDLRDLPRTAERDTVFGLEKQLFRNPAALEMPLPPNAALARIEHLADHARRGAPDPSLRAAGDRWFVLPVGFIATPCRVLVPEHADGDELPLVVTVHGMGGSEQNFFEIYGRGLAARLAAERGWIVASPGGLGMIGSGADVNDIVTALEELLPVDRSKVFLIGHSLGAMRIVKATGDAPRRYRAIAPLSGTGPIAPGTDLGRLPAYVAAGAQDFGLGMSQVLKTVLETSNAAVTYREIDPAEHIMMVPEVLPEVFRFFEQALESEPERGTGETTPASAPEEPRRTRL